jgi:putative addiction module killer protein
MEGQKREIREYLRPDGKCPFRNWLRSLKDVNARARIRVRINRIRLGNFGDCKSVGGGVSELRVDYGPGYRVYFGRVGEKLVLLLCGGSKKGQEKDIKLAKEYWYDYKRRINE